MSVYYSDDAVTLYHGDCREEAAWLAADVLVTDPPYGRKWSTRSGFTNAEGRGSSTRRAITGDDDTSCRDAALALWGDRPAVVFGDLMLAPPPSTKQVLIYAKADDAGIRASTAGFRRDAEAIYLVGPWPSGIGGRTSVLRPGGHVAGPTGPAAIHGHPHSKPLGLMEALVWVCPPGDVADPFAGSGATLVAAKVLGRRAIGVEIDERYCEIAARRLSQEVLDFSAVTS